MTSDLVDPGTVGHDAGRLVLRLERSLAAPPALVRDAVTAEEARPDERWEVEEGRPGSRVVLTAWLDVTDVDAAADAGADRHRRFEHVLRALDEDQAGDRQRRCDRDVLVDEYAAAFAAALADTD